MVRIIGCLRYNSLPLSDSEEVLCYMNFLKEREREAMSYCCLFHFSQAGMGTGKERQSE